MTKNDALFTDEQLSEAAAIVRERMLASLAYPEKPVPAALEAKIKALWTSKRRRASVNNVLRWAAAVLIVCLLGFSAYVASSPSARAAIIRWTRGIFSAGMVYSYQDTAGITELPKYELGWMPKGYTVTKSQRDEYTDITIYKNEAEGKFVMFICHKFEENGKLFVYQSEFESAEVNGMPADYYPCIEPRNDNTLLWMDDINGATLQIDSNEEKSVIIHMAERVKLVK